MHEDQVPDEEATAGLGGSTTVPLIIALSLAAWLLLLGTCFLIF